MKLLTLIFLLFVQLSGIAQSQNKSQKSIADDPTVLRQYVVDETGTLTSAQINELNTKLRNEEKSTSNQIVVYMINSLNGESLEDVSMKLAEKNKIGKKDKNNGVLMLIVKNDRKIRIEVGYGLEGVLTDAKSSSIIRNEITPSFKSGNYYEGISKGINPIIAVTKGEYTADKNDSDTIDIGCCMGMPIFVIIIFGIIFFFILSSFLRAIFGVGRSLYSGKRGWSSGWGGGSWGSGRSSGSSWGGGGGFSGGGGSFGGGGASGSW